MAVKAAIVSEFNNKGVKDAESAFGGLSKSAKVAGAAVAASFVAVTAALGKAVQMAAEDQASFQQLAVTLKNVTGANDAFAASVDRQIGKMALASGIADDQLRPAMANLVRATGSVSLSQEALATAMDLSVATGRDMDSISLALGKSLNGQTTALLKMLPGLKGVVENGMPAADILAAINAQVGGAANAQAQTFAGQIERLKLVFGEMAETVGSWLIPVLTHLADFINTYLVQYFTYLSDVIGPKVEGVFAKLGKVFREDIAPVLNDYVIPAFEYLFAVYRDKILPIIEALVRVFVDKLGKAFSMLRDKLDENRDSFLKLREFMDKVFVFVERYLGPAIVKFYDKYLDGLIWTVGKTIDAFVRMGEIVGPIIGTVGKIIGSVVKGIVNGINTAIGAINSFIGIYTRLPGFLKPFGDIPLMPTITLPEFDLTNYKPGGMGIWGENRGDMAGATTIGGVDLGGPAAPEAARGGKAGPSAPPALASIAYVPTGIDPFEDNPYVRRMGGIPAGGINVNVNGGLATSAEIGAAVVDAIKQFTNVSGPADIAVA